MKIERAMVTYKLYVRVVWRDLNEVGRENGD